MKRSQISKRSRMHNLLAAKKARKARKLVRKSRTVNHCKAVKVYPELVLCDRFRDASGRPSLGIPSWQLWRG